MIGTWTRWRRRRPLKPISDFEVLRKWEASKFAFQIANGSHLHQSIPLDQQRCAFGWFDPLKSNNDNHVARLAFKGRRLDAGTDVQLSAAARLIAQFKCGDNYLVIVADDFFSSIKRVRPEFSLSANPSQFLAQFPVFSGVHHVVCFWLNSDLSLMQKLVFQSPWMMIKSKRYIPHPNNPSLFLVPAELQNEITKNALRLHLFHGPVIEIAVGNETGANLQDEEAISLGALVHWWPIFMGFRPIWQASNISMQAADYPVLVRVNVWRSLWRQYTGWFRSPPKPEAFPRIDFSLGWTDYQGGALEDEFKRYPMRRYFKWLK